MMHQLRGRACKMESKPAGAELLCRMLAKIVKERNNMIDHPYVKGPASAGIRPSYGRSKSCPFDCLSVERRNYVFMLFAMSKSVEMATLDPC
ncbi:hypothetical protein IE53DRAFT_134710 [Violaceomyces palustris]|uniref:Uncharacterized protein n=1 Tax=Violaceomyces palustris TaxID=1673888 RepID=A0ACD0NV31_9BASI|nr:hypothetical protein IE53DRAFT_134710 [Violaceomyces palustris]